jgi:hypothetical protein
MKRILALSFLCASSALLAMNNEGPGLLERLELHEREFVSGNGLRASLDDSWKPQLAKGSENLRWDNQTFPLLPIAVTVGESEVKVVGDATEETLVGGRMLIIYKLNTKTYGAVYTPERGAEYKPERRIDIAQETVDRILTVATQAMEREEQSQTQGEEHKQD